LAPETGAVEPSAESKNRAVPLDSETEGGSIAPVTVSFPAIVVFPDASTVNLLTALFCNWSRKPLAPVVWFANKALPVVVAPIVTAIPDPLCAPAGFLATVNTLELSAVVDEKATGTAPDSAIVAPPA
jgi:hypothetical protein